jgi:micrococcal nuclease
MEEQLYYYRAKVVDVYDGDTMTVDIDLGLHIWSRDEKVRLARINAPELRGAEREKGLAARDFLRSRVLDKNIIIETIKDREEKFGRYLGEIWIKNDAGEFININDLIVQNGHAEYKEY